MRRFRADPRLATRALLLCASVVLGACDDHDVTPPGNTPVATRLAVVTAPTATAESRVALLSPPTVRLQDASGNAVAQSGVTVTATVSGVAATLTGATATTGADGRATFTGLTIAGRAGARTLTFSASGLTPASAAVTLTAGRPALLGAVTSQTATGATGVAVSTPPSVRLMDADSNAISGATVTFAATGGGGTVTGGSAVTNASGVATVGAWTLGATAGTNTLTVTTAALPGVSVVFTATGAAPTGTELLSFALPRAVNETSVDGDVTIAGSSVTAFLPPGTARTALKPTFIVSPGATVTVNGVTQTSGASTVDFTGAVTYEVRAPNGSTASYIVTLVTDIASIDAVMTAFMSKYNVPGLSLAITRDENLVYAKAYGRADATTPLMTSHLFRTASVSKPITAAAIFRLVDQGRLTLSQKVFGPGAILGTAYGAPPYRPGVADITVDHLLYHIAGGWTNDGNDPMFKQPTMTADQLITWTIANQALVNTPGTTFAYSNFGYSILGRVIEKITGQPYEAAVKSLLLAPAGIGAMRIGGNTLAERVPNEVTYTGQGGNPYAFNLARMDAHGGWIASAVDLAKFLVRVDGGTGKADLLSPGSIAAMSTGSSVYTGYGRGWSVNGPNWWHNGGLPGTGTQIMRITSHGRFNAVILTNTQTAGTYFADLDKLFWDARAATARWPAYDLFAGFP